MLRPLIYSLLVALVAGQTGQCGDGWVVYEGHHHHHGPPHCTCFKVGEMVEKVTAADADLICSSQDSWLAEIHDTQMNEWVKGELRKHYEPQYLIPGLKFDRQYWIGAKVSSYHSDSHYGNWTWTHSGREVGFFDWMKHEPNDWHSQNCMTYLVDQDVFGFGAWHWNDWSCDYVASALCQKPCTMPNSTLTL